MIHLTPTEAAKASELASALNKAEERDMKAITAWRTFLNAFQASHPEMPGLRFTSDFRLAISLPTGDANDLNDARPVKMIELTLEEQHRLQGLHGETVESLQAARKAEAAWRDYQHELPVDHHVPDSESGTATTINGKTVTVPAPWGNGVVFSPDFRLAFPRGWNF